MPPVRNSIAAVQPGSTLRPHGSAERSVITKVSQANSPTNDFARSHAAQWIPPCAIVPEKVALKSLKMEWNKTSPGTQAWDGYRSKRPVMIADLHDFEIYLSPDGFKARSYELLGLHHLEVPRSKKMLFDGLLCIGGIKHYVEGIPVRDYSIEGYGDSDEPTTATYIQSALGGKDPAHDIWYRLNKPTKAYARHHDPFLWVAQLAKHVLDYLDEQPRASVGLEHFRSKFQQWLATRFLAHKAFNVWYHAITDRGDFRICVNAYIEFLYQQAYNLPNSENLLAHPLWADCMAGGLSQVVVQERIVQDTLATPDVYDCFKHMYFSGVIRSMPLSPDVKARQQRRMSEMGFQSATEAHLERTPKGHAYGRFPVQVGDVVAFDPDKADKQKWRNADWEWLLYVTDIQLLRTGVQQLFGLYLYRPRETDIFIAQYRYQNELFFSDNCNCDDGALLSTDIKGRYDIQWTPATMPSDAFFVRQTYITEESSFVTFVEKHKICECKKQRPSKANRFRRGDTVYITITVDGRTILEPVIIHQVEEASAGFTVRRFARLSRDLAEQANHVRKSTIAINELVLTDKYEKVIMTRIQRQCHIRFVLKSDVLMNRIPSPYNRKGAGDCWFFSMGLSVKDGTSSIEFLARAPNYVKQGCLPEASDKRLRGMSLFSGGGNLDRGVEEGGVVDVRTVVEWDAAAIHTQRANAQDVTTQQLFCGSVDEHLKLAIDGSASRLVPRIGDVNITIAGSPCPGFSALQQNFMSPQSVKNASHVTTICSYVDLYRPEYALLENVVSMADTRKGLEDQNVLSQLVAFFVSLGYQVNQYIMDAWTYGSCQQRSRVILTIAAPGLNSIQQPLHTHSLPIDDTAGRSLGILPNGQRFGGREHYPTPFSHVFASTATSDLPNIGNGNVQTCISHPNHRVSAQPSRKDRALLELIPRSPPGFGYREAYKMGCIPAYLEKPGKEFGRAYQRIKGSHLVPTITTGLNIQDSRNGATIHWQQDRPITILEARRTQGYLDHEPIIGSLSAQYRIVGNGVDRQVAFALGQAIRQAVIANRQHEAGPEARAPTLVDVEDDEDHFSDSASTRSGLDACVPPSRNGAATFINASLMLAKQSQEKASSTDGDQGDETAVTEMSGLDGASDIQDSPPTAPHSSTTSILSRMSMTIAHGIKELAHRSRRSLPISTTAPSSKPSKRSYDEFSDRSSDLSVYPLDRPMGARKQIRLADRAQP